MLSSPAYVSCFPITPYTPRNISDQESVVVSGPRPVIAFDQERGLVISLRQSPPLSILGSPTSTDNELDTTSHSSSPPLSLPNSINSSLSSFPSNDESRNNLDEEGGLPSSTSTTQSSCPNEPNQMLETPLLYFMLKMFPRIMSVLQRFYRFRWMALYPLQRRIGFGVKPEFDMTWGEVLFVLPFFAAIIASTVYTFAIPSTSATGHCCRIPLIFCFLTAMKNSFVTFLLGIPFDRTLFYHKLSGRIAFVNSILHMMVAFLHPRDVSTEGIHFLAYLGLDTVNTAGTMLLIFMASLLVTSTPIVRQKAYEIFYYLHVLYAAAMIGCAFYHSGVIVPILGSICWCTDVIVRKGIMAFARYPKEATIRILSESVVEIRFPKCQGFDYNPGQYILIAVPELSMFQWHPFSLSSSPCQKVVTLHIRKAGNWTKALYNLAKEKDSVRILMEGPYGSLGVDLMSERYKMIMLLSGGTGVAPMQSICNQVVYEQSRGMHDPIKKLSFVWTERDPSLMSEVEVVRRSSMSVAVSNDMEQNQEQHENDLPSPTLLQLTEGEPMGIASVMLALVPASSATDEELNILYPYSSDEIEAGRSADAEDHSMSTIQHTNRKRFSPGMSTTCGDDDTVLDKAYCPRSERDFLDLKVFLTSDNKVNHDVSNLPFVHIGRPNIYLLLRNMKEEAMQLGEKYVAVCVCAPEPLVKACGRACAKLSDRNVQFDLHEETFT